MTTIAAGASATVTIPQGSKLKTTGIGIAVRGPGSRANQPTALRDATSFGPYQHDQVIYLTATTDMAYVIEANVSSLPVAHTSVDADNNFAGLVGPDGKVILFSSSTAYKPAVSQYERALVIPQIRQANAVKGLSRNINDAQYIGPITDAEVYDTETGALSVGQATTKALAFPWGKTLWDLANGESLLIQARVKTVAAATSSNVLFGNSDATWEGFGLVLYGPTHATNAGKLFFNFKANGTGAQAIQLQPAVVAGATVSAVPLATDTYYNITIHVDGATRRLDSWVNCQQSLNASTLLNAGSTVPAAKHNFGLGYIPADDGFTATTAKAARFQSFRMAVLPAGLKFINPGLLDLHFNVNPYRLFNDTDYVGGV